MSSAALCKCRRACRAQRDVRAGACERQCTTDVRKGGVRSRGREEGGRCKGMIERRLDVADVSET